MPRKSKTSAAARSETSAHESGTGEAISREYAAYRPRTALGKRLWKIRKKIIESGEALLDRDEIEREVAERRGESE